MTEPLPKPNPPLTCDEAVRQINCLVEEGSLLTAERALLMAHLEGCSNCRSDLERRRQLDARLREAFADLDTRPDFTARLLALLPKREGGISSAWRRPSVRLSGPRGTAREGQRVNGISRTIGRTVAWPLAAAAALLLLVLGWRLMRGTEPAIPLAAITDFEGALEIERGHETLAPTEDLWLKPGDVLTARLKSGVDIGACRLTVDGRPFCTIRLADGAELSVNKGTGHYELRQGEAYFEVSPTRWGAPENAFAVRTKFGQVLVEGTSFGIIVPSPQASTVTVVVDEGVVELKPWTGKSRRVGAHLECSFDRDGRTSDPEPILAGRLRRLRPMAVAVVPPSAVPTAPPVGPTAVPAPAPRHVDWTAGITDLDFRGRTLTEAIRRLQERVGPAEEWPLLIAQAERLSPEGRSALQVRRPIRVDALLRWLAREQGLRFAAPVTLRTAAPDELLGAPEDGHIPADLAGLLERDVQGLADSALGEEALNLLANHTGLAVLVHPGTRLPRVERQASWWGLLERLALTSDTDWAWYDGLLYVASDSDIEALTRRPRTEPLGRWLGPQLLPAWERSLQRLVSGLDLNAEGLLTLAPKGMLAEVAIYPDERGLRYVSGIRGVRTVTALHHLVVSGSAAVPDASAVLNELEAVGTYRTLGDLVTLARSRAPVVWEGGERTFPMQSFSVRRMPLGRALEQAARLHGLGLRLEPGRIVVDERAACYGEPAFQVVSLAAVAERCPRASLHLPGALAREARACWPELLKDVEWLPLHQALCFHGNAQQLAAVQEVARGMDRAAREPGFDPQDWRMPWRVDVERNLAEPFQGDESGTLPAGSFVGLLRQSGLLIPLKTPVLVDPDAMKESANRPVSALDVRGRTMGEVLGMLAREVGLRMIIEDEVIWLKP